MCQVLEQPPSPPINHQTKQRDEKGRFAQGNPGGHGNPFGRRVAELRRAMLDAVSAIEIAAIIQATPDMPLKVVNASRFAIGFLQQKQLEEASSRKEQSGDVAPSTDGSVAPLECDGSTSLSFFERSRSKKESGVQPPHSKGSPSTDGFVGPKAKLPKGSFTDVPLGMEEFYQTLIERGYAPPIPTDDER